MECERDESELAPVLPVLRAALEWSTSCWMVVTRATSTCRPAARQGKLGSLGARCVRGPARAASPATLRIGAVSRGQLARGALHARMTRRAHQPCAACGAATPTLQQRGAAELWPGRLHGRASSAPGAGPAPPSGRRCRRACGRPHASPAARAWRARAPQRTGRACPGAHAHTPAQGTLALKLDLRRQPVPRHAQTATSQFISSFSPYVSGAILNSRQGAGAAGRGACARSSGRGPPRAPV